MPIFFLELKLSPAPLLSIRVPVERRVKKKRGTDQILIRLLHYIDKE